MSFLDEAKSHNPLRNLLIHATMSPQQMDNSDNYDL
jgi:hypothetical protein